MFVKQLQPTIPVNIRILLGNTCSHQIKWRNCVNLYMVWRVCCEYSQSWKGTKWAVHLLVHVLYNSQLLFIKINGFCAAAVTYQNWATFIPLCLQLSQEGSARLLGVIMYQKKIHGLTGCDLSPRIIPAASSLPPGPRADKRIRSHTDLSVQQFSALLCVQATHIPGIVIILYSHMDCPPHL